MQILPTTFVLLTILALFSFSMLKNMLSIHTTQSHFATFYHEQKARLSQAVDTQYEKERYKPPKKKRASPQRRSANTTPVNARNREKQLKPIAIQETNKELLAFCQRYFMQLYANVTMDGKQISTEQLAKRFEKYLEKAKQWRQKNAAPPQWEDILNTEHPLDIKLYKGTTEMDFEQHKGYPSITRVFTFEEATRPVPFDGLTPEGVRLFFPKQLAESILHAEREKSKRSNRPSTLSQEEFQQMVHNISPRYGWLSFRFRGRSVKSEDK